MNKLGFGCMRLPILDKNDVSTIDVEQAKKMTDMFLERGFTYFDTAWMYHSFKSEEAVREMLTSRHPRDSYQIATKLHAAYFESEEERDNILKTQFEKIGVDYFDYYLLHDMSDDYYENKYKKLGCLEWQAEKKKEGLFKNIGFSFHDTPEVLDKILSENPQFDFVQLQINYLDWDSLKVQSRRCYEVARKYGKNIIVMEPVKGGLLSMLPEEAEKLMDAVHPDWSKPEWAVKFAASLEGVIMVLSGMSNIAQLEDNTRYMQKFEGLTEEDKTVLKKCVEIINSDIKIPCTGCNYCADACAKNIPISSCFSLYNAAHKIGNRDFSIPKDRYESQCRRQAKASDCVECGGCEIICPQNLPIRKYLKDVAEYFGQ